LVVALVPLQARLWDMTRRARLSALLAARFLALLSGQSQHRKGEDRVRISAVTSAVMARFIRHRAKAVVAAATAADTDRILLNDLFNRPEISGLFHLTAAAFSPTRPRSDAIAGSDHCSYFQN
jgi:hypothetical protein